MVVHRLLSIIWRAAEGRLELIVLLGLAVAALVFFWRTELALTGGRLGVPLDDAWIHYQFARNLSQGHGFSYNPGEPTPGSTAPLWTLFLVPAGWLGLDFVRFSVLLSAAFFLLVVALTYGFTRSLTGSRLAAGLAAGGVVLSGRLVWAGLAGMETTAFTAFSLVAVWAYTRRGLRPLPALLFGLASQLRPEGHALFSLAVLDTVWQIARAGQERESRRPALGRLAGSLAVYGGVAAPYALFGLATTGKPLPNTFYAKVGSQYFLSLRTLLKTGFLHWSDNPTNLLLIPLGLRPVWRRSHLVVGWLASLPLLTAMIVEFVWHHGRYTMPLIPFQMIVAAAGAAWLVSFAGIRGLGDFSWFHPQIRQSPPEKSRTVARYGVAVLVGVGVFLGGWWQFGNWATMLGTNTDEILDVDVGLGHWLAANTPADALLAVDDIGAITFLSQRRIVDLNGLVSPEMWPAISQPPGLARSRVAARILSELRPAYMVAFSLWHWEIATNPAVAQPVHQVRADTYTILAQQDVVVYQMAWPYVAEAEPLVARSATLGEAIRLLGYDWQPPAAGQPLSLTLYWQSLAPVAAEYDVFVHVLAGDGRIVAQADQQPLQGLAPTNLWQPGDVVRDPYQIELPPELPAGMYTLQTGMYLRETGARLPVVGEQASGDTIFLETLGWPPG